jgi:hypothetical protein
MLKQIKANAVPNKIYYLLASFASRFLAADPRKILGRETKQGGICN